MTPPALTTTPPPTRSEAAAHGVTVQVWQFNGAGSCDGATLQHLLDTLPSWGASGHLVHYFLMTATPCARPMRQYVQAHGLQRSVFVVDRFGQHNHTSLMAFLNSRVHHVTHRFTGLGPEAVRPRCASPPL